MIHRIPYPLAFRALAFACIAVSALVSSTGLSATVGDEPESAGPESPEPEPVGPHSLPHWIWCGGERSAPTEVCFRTAFEVNGEAVRGAQLIVEADFCDAEVALNGHAVGHLQAYSPGLSVDVVRQLRQGQNHLAIGCQSTTGPAAVLAHLTLRMADGSTRTVSTDRSWHAVAGGSPDWRDPQAVTNDWPAATSLGAASSFRAPNSVHSIAIDELDDYSQWMRALGSGPEKTRPSFLVARGFQIELVRSAAADEGSWVSLEFDDRGRLIVAREERGLLRMTLSERGEVTRVETINDSLLECRGLLWAYGSLYVHANNSKSLYRLRDTDGDEQFDEVKLLRETGGDVGHGRNDLALGPDGMIYAICGDSVNIPRDAVDHTSPLREHRRGRETSEGFVYRTDREGTTWEIVAAGLRNPYGIDFNIDGEPFTYDADAEFDMGASWYRPTRVVHLVTGADFGWRGVTGAWPPYFPDHPDNGVPSFDIGKGSPTGVKFGTHSHFPPPYRRALFMLDWAYGRILAVHLTPHGASYRCSAETFVKGKPLNVTDLGFGPDGAMYVVTGGRKTQAGLYRVRYVGEPIEEPPPSPQELARADFSRRARAIRKQIETTPSDDLDRTLDLAWPALSDPDPWIRAAARTAVERLPVAAWRDRAWMEDLPERAIAGLLLLARQHDPGREAPDAQSILERLNTIPLAALKPADQLNALYVCERCLSADRTESQSSGSPALPASLAKATAAHLETLVPHASPAVARNLGLLLTRLRSDNAVSYGMSQLERASDPLDVFHYLFVLRNQRAGWTHNWRATYFRALRDAGEFQGGQGMPGFLEKIRAEALATLPPDQQAEFAALLTTASTETVAHAPRPVVRKWTVPDLHEALARDEQAADLVRGREMFDVAQCSRCHRMGRHGTLIGPDLTAVGRRFSRRDLLQSVVTPSQVVAENYRSVRVVTVEGQVFTGRVVPSGDYRAEKLKIATDLSQPTRTVEVEKKLIESHETLATSWMPEGLLDTLHAEEVRDLLAYITSE